MDIVVITSNLRFIILELFMFVQDVLDSLEFARGSANSSWGSVRAAMGHPEPFPVKYAAIGNEDCGKKFYNGKLKRSCVPGLRSCVIMEKETQLGHILKKVKKSN